MYSMPESVSLKSFASMAIVSGKVASNTNVSALKDRSVVIGTESSPTSSPFTHRANQLSAQTSAVIDTVSVGTVSVDTVSVDTVSVDTVSVDRVSVDRVVVTVVVVASPAEVTSGSGSEEQAATNSVAARATPIARRVLDVLMG